MKPTALEALRAIQGTVAETLGPELQTAFAVDAAQTLAMLTESLAAEWDRAAEDLRADNAAIRTILIDAPDALKSLSGRNENRDALVSEIDGVMREAGDGAITISSLSAEHNRLAAVFERLLCLAEDTVGEPGGEALAEVRRRTYAHLREVAVRGWCFWDVASFRERMVRARSETSA